MTRALIGLGLGTALIVVPFSLRRHAIDGAVSPFPVSGGLNFYIGNHPGATGGFVSLEHLNISLSPVEQITQSVAVAQREAGKRLTASEASRHWLGKGLLFIRDNPSRFVVLSLKKMLLFWNKNEGESNINFTFSKQFLPLFDLPLFSFVVLGPLALVGLTLALWRRETAFSLIVAFVVAYLLSLCLVFMASRYRLPCVPLIIILAADAVNCLGYRSEPERPAKSPPWRSCSAAFSCWPTPPSRERSQAKIFPSPGSTSGTCIWNRACSRKRPTT